MKDEDEELTIKKNDEPKSGGGGIKMGRKKLG